LNVPCLAALDRETHTYIISFSHALLDTRTEQLSSGFSVDAQMDEWLKMLQDGNGEDEEDEEGEEDSEWEEEEEELGSASKVRGPFAFVTSVKHGWQIYVCVPASLQAIV
jgi:hypothetical protein